MKKLYLLIIFLLLLGFSPKTFANETQAKIYIDKLVLLVGPSDFVSYIKEVQSKVDLNMANPYAPRRELSQEQSYYWTYFEPEEYINELKKQIFDTFTSREIEEIYKFYKNPYHAKYLLHFNTKARMSNFNKRIKPLGLMDLSVSKDKEVLVRNLLTMFIIRPLIDNEEKLLEKELNRIDQIYSVVKLSNNVELERDRKNIVKYQKNFKKLVMRYFVSSFDNFRKSEMRYMVNAMKDKALIQKFSALILTYHYYYILKYDEIFKSKENTKKKLEEKENYKF
jgi:hypothetical protein